MPVATARSMPSTAMPRGAVRGGVGMRTSGTRTDNVGDVSDELKEFWRIADENHRYFSAMGFNDETIEDFIDEVIHEGREILDPK